MTMTTSLEANVHDFLALVSPEAVEYCRRHDISVIAGACPMMFGPGADFGHTCMRWFLKLTGGPPA